ncbi:MAG: hypothetical protein AB7H97_12470 [Pseudobdellovibrionaceae bacterium]
MSGELVTLSKSHPRFEEYLLGTFSEQQVALPIQSLNVNTPKEQVTFKILRANEIKAPATWYIWLMALRPWQLGSLVFSILIIIFSPGMDAFNNFFNLPIAAAAVLGVLCLYVSLYLRNDFHDHCYGLDRLQSSGGSQVIQKGWLRAITVSRASWIFFALGLLFGVPVVVSSPAILFLVGVLTLLGVLGLSLQNWGLKYKGGSEVLSFLLLGPLLALGLGLAVYGEWDWQWLMIGSLLGAQALFVIFNRNLEQILGASQAQVRNVMTYLGFDRSKVLLRNWLLLLTAGFFSFHLYYSHLSVVIISTVVVLRFVYRYIRFLNQVDSCVGSGVSNLRSLSQVIQFAFLFSWFLGLVLELRG